MTYRKYLSIAITLVLSLTCVFPLKGQTALHPSLSEPMYGGIPFPGTSGKVGRKDQLAISLITSYVNATDPSSADGICGTGTISISNVTETQIHTSLSLDRHGRFRLDLSTPSGVRSIRMNGAVGGIFQEDGTVVKFPMSTSEAGLFPSPGLLRKVLADQQATLEDNGTVRVGDAAYLSVTYELPLNPRRHITTLSPPLITQLLFDPQTQLLVKAVEKVRLSEVSRSSHLRVMTFNDYRRTDTGLLPMSISESIDAQPTWTIVFDHFASGCSNDPDYFNLVGVTR